jgi:hypothetical protein
MVIFVSEPEMLLRFVDGLKTAAGSAHQLAHTQENPNWLKVRDMLENLIESGQKMAMARSMPRQDVLSELALREQAARTDH